MTSADSHSGTVVLGRLILIRHAKTQYDRSLIPPADPPLDPLASHDYAAIVSHLPNNWHWISSPLKRCLATTENLISHGAEYAKISKDDRLVEQSYGRWHGQDIAAVWETELAAGPKHNWHFLHPDHIPPDGESFHHLTQRVTPILHELSTSGQDHVVITHGMVIRAMVGVALGLMPDQAMAFDIAPLSMTGLSRINSGISTDHANGGAWQINFLNRVF
jgi:broad specificity phosphatase PhoE